MTKIERTLLGISVAIGAACVAKAEEPAKAVSCYVEGSGQIKTNQQASGPRVETLAAGVGCKTTANGLQVGGFGRLDIGSSQRQGTIGGTVGIGALGTSSAYAIGGYSFDASNGANTIAIQKGGVFVVGAGVEQKISGDTAVFAEVLKDLASIGAARNMSPLYSARVGVRVGF